MASADVAARQIHVVDGQFQQGGLGGVDQGLCLAEMLLELGFVGTRVKRREIRFFRGENFLVNIERTARRAHRNGGDF